MTNVEREKLFRKAYYPSKLTDKELAQVRRSSCTGSNLLCKVIKEQEKRGLLKYPMGRGCSGYPPEKKKLIRDYD